MSLKSKMCLSNLHLVRIGVFQKVQGSKMIIPRMLDISHTDNNSYHLLRDYDVQ